LNASSFARDGFVNPESFRTNWSDDARISSFVAGGEKLCRVLMARHMSDSQHSTVNHQLFLRSSFRILWKIVGDRIRWRASGDEDMKLRPTSRIIIECAHPNRYQRASRPIAAEQTRPAILNKTLLLRLRLSHRL
jgi:hypothetical protein